MSVSRLEIFWDKYRLGTEGIVKELSGKSLSGVHEQNSRSVGFGFWKQMHVRSIVKKPKWPLHAWNRECLLQTVKNVSWENSEMQDGKKSEGL